MSIPVEDEYEASKRRLQEFKRKIGITEVNNKDNTKDTNIATNTFDCSMFTPVRESLMGLVGIS